MKPRNVWLIVIERLYESEHARVVAEFEQIQEMQDDDELGFWISKQWLKGKRHSCLTNPDVI